MDNNVSSKLEGSSGDGKNLQTSEKLYDDVCKSNGPASCVSAKDTNVVAINSSNDGSNISNQFKSNLLSFAPIFENAGFTGSKLAVVPQIPAKGETNNGIIPPYMLEELAKRNPLVPHYQDTLDKMKGHFWPFPPHPSSNNNGDREVYDAKGKETQPGKKARFEGQKKTGNEEVDNAYDFTGQVRSFYKDVFNRNSIDGNGMKFVSTVNYGQNYENAFWNGKQMTYGKPSSDSPFKTFVLLDVCGHEITHGVTEKESSLKYYGQAGSLNESLSDVFGELIKQRASNQLAKDADWIVGSGIWKPTVHGRGLRDMLNPGTAYDDPNVGKDPQPAHMKDYYKTSGDNGGVHYNSGIPNKAFASFAVSVGGYAYDEPAKIWYAARKAAGSEPSFAQFAYQTIEQAKKLGYTSDVPKLQKAWEDVGVKPSATDTDTDTPVKPAAKDHVGWTPLYNNDSGETVRKTKPAA